MPKKSVFTQVRHPFWFHFKTGSGKVTAKKILAKVRAGSKPVTIVLEAHHVERSIKEKGRGDTNHCAMAICTYEHANAFPHKVEGHVDWQYSRAFVVSRVNKYGLPIECYAYEHNSQIARNQDAPARKSDGKTGQDLLLEQIKKCGPVAVVLKPYRQRSVVGRPGKGRGNTGVRASKPKGAKLRYAVAQLGAQPHDAAKA